MSIQNSKKRAVAFIKYINPNNPGFSEPGKAGGTYLKANDHEIWWCHTMSKALPANNKRFDDVMTMTFYDVILYFGLCLGKPK